MSGNVRAYITAFYSAAVARYRDGRLAVTENPVGAIEAFSCLRAGAMPTLSPSSRSPAG